ncbi:MAG: DUF3883 domain-containing protein [Ignavibacteria bacterium]|nr:DUF3883 domain-containing protein [Ignavibacteria bacterium]
MAPVVATGDSRQLSIEVKASTMGYAGAFHVTQNEWERSQEVDNHLPLDYQAQEARR